MHCRPDPQHLLPLEAIPCRPDPRHLLLLEAMHCQYTDLSRGTERRRRSWRINARGDQPAPSWRRWSCWRRGAQGPRVSPADGNGSVRPSCRGPAGDPAPPGPQYRGQRKQPPRAIAYGGRIMPAEARRIRRRSSYEPELENGSRRQKSREAGGALTKQTKHPTRPRWRKAARRGETRRRPVNRTLYSVGAK